MNHISFSTKQAKAIKTLLLNQDFKNEVTLQILEGLKRVDNDMTLEEAHRIVDKMNQEKRDAVNNILSGKMKQPTHYNINEASRRFDLQIKEIIFLLLFLIIIGTLIIELTYISAGIFLCWTIYLIIYTDYIIPRWIKIQILPFLRNKDFKVPNQKK